MTPTPASPASAAQDYAHDLRVKATRPEVIAALTDETVISRWWTVVTSTARQGDDVQLLMGDRELMVAFTVGRTDPERISWAVTSCVVADWVGTTPTFELHSNADGSCDISFRHVGLVPALECFDDCRAGWNHFMPSLQMFLETGQGRPAQPR